MADSWTVIDGYRVQHTTEKAVLIAKGTAETWVPRSCIEDHEQLEIGDTDLIVRTWFVEREELDA